MTLHVALIARPGASVEPCRSALEAAGAAPVVYRLERDGAYAQARNRALADAPDGLLALVEDDVVVVPAWLAALEAAWAAPGAERIGVVGGPLRPPAADRRPAWMDADLATAFATHDYGSEPCTLDPAAQTFHGGNVSFRVAALRGVGGFWPARGHADGRDWFSEEHHAQRQLARAGWQLAYAPLAAAQRTVDRTLTPGRALRRRARYGARRAVMADPPPRSSAAALAARAAAGVPAALTRGARAQAVSRAGRAAENAAAAAGGAFAARDFEATARRTPFLGSVPLPARRRARWARRPHGGASPSAILMYHRVLEQPEDARVSAVDPTRFAAQMEVLASEFTVRPLTELGAGAVAITFDDGYADNARNAVPALEARGLPATLFASTGHIRSGRGFWWDLVSEHVGAAPADAGTLTVTLEGDTRAWPAGDAAERAAAIAHLQAWLQFRSPDAVAAAVDQIAHWAGRENGPPLDRDRPLTVDELRRVGAGPVTIGAHGRTHRSLAWADADAQHEELLGSANDLAHWLGRRPTAFAYPYGVPGVDVDTGVRDAARSAGYALAVVNAPGVVTDRSDRFGLPRLAVPDIDGAAFAAWLRAHLRR